LVKYEKIVQQIAAMEAGLQGYIEILKSRGGTGFNLHCPQMKHKGKGAGRNMPLKEFSCKQCGNCCLNFSGSHAVLFMQRIARVVATGYRL